jgi:hypothetical protein
MQVQQEIWGIYLFTTSPVGAQYFSTLYIALIALQKFTARCAVFSSTESAKLKREHGRRRKKRSSAGRSKIQHAAPVKTIITHNYASNKIKQTSQINAPFIITTQEFNKYIKWFTTNTISLWINI